jgi:signal transduction histidine kinase
MAAQPELDLSLQGVVHDLANVFETVSEAADLLAEDEKWATLAAAIHRSVARGRRIVEGIRETACGNVELETVLARAIESTRDLLQLVHGPRVEFRTEVAAGTRLKGVSVAWERVLLNLFLNAVQAMPRGGCIDVRAWCADGEAMVEVSDNGPGISTEVLPHIFEPHFSTRPSGTGLGLHIVDSIVRRQGGSVAARNRVDAAGAAFTIRLPL